MFEKSESCRCGFAGQVIAWVLGEYARLATVDGYTIEDIADLLSECIERPPAWHALEDLFELGLGGLVGWSDKHGLACQLGVCQV